MRKQNSICLHFLAKKVSGPISPNFLATVKVASAWRLAKDTPFNFTKDLVTGILNQNKAETPFAEKGVDFSEQNICTQMLVKLTTDVS
jgi:hypothetical protein